MISNKQTNNGFALLLAIIISSVALAIGLSMLNIALKQLTLGSTTNSSEIAFQSAQSGIECIQYYALNSSNDYVTQVGGSGTPDLISCFNTSLYSSDEDSYHTGGAGAYTNEFHYVIDWGSAPQTHCTEMDLYVMNNPSGSDYTVDFSAQSEAVGSKTCPADAICRVAIGRGFNRSCADLNAGLATVQRELTSEF